MGSIGCLAFKEIRAGFSLCGKKEGKLAKKNKNKKQNKH